MASIVQPSFATWCLSRLSCCTSLLSNTWPFNLPSFWWASRRKRLRKEKSYILRGSHVTQTAHSWNWRTAPRYNLWCWVGWCLMLCHVNTVDPSINRPYWLQMLLSSSSAIKCISNSMIVQGYVSMIQEGFERRNSFHRTALAWKYHGSHHSICSLRSSHCYRATSREWRFSGWDVGKANGGWSSGLFRCVLGRPGAGQSEEYYRATRICQ